MRTKFKSWAEPYIKEHPKITIPLEEIKKYKDIYLEIGSGKGQFLIDMSKKYPDLLFLGIEKNVTCSGITAKKIVESQSSNAKLIWEDFARISMNFVDGSIKKIFLNFSDPWPKKRHHKRRLTSNLFLKEYQRILSNDGEIIFKTDNIDLFNDSIETFNESGLKIVSIDNDYDGNNEFDAQTEYEISFRNKGVKINRMVVRK